MKPANLNHLRTFLARTDRHASESQFTIHDLRRKCGMILAAAICLVAMSEVASAVTCTSAAGANNWATVGTWNCGHVPVAGDDVVIADASTVTINTTPVPATGSLASITVGQGVSGTLIFDATPRAISVGDVTVAAGGTFITQAATTATHTMSISGNLVNNGTFDMSRGGTTLICNVTFNKNGSQTISGTGGTTRFRNIIINMGTSNSNILEVTSSNFAASTPFLTITNGTFKYSTTPTISVSTTSNLTIPATGGLWVNGGNVTAGTSASLINNGLVQVSAGTLNVGAGNNRLEVATGATGTFSGGTINIGGRFTLSGGSTTISGTAINVDPQVGATLLGATSNTFEVSGTAGISFTSGTLTIVDPINGTGTGRDILISSTGSLSFSGGTISLGDGTSSTSGSTDGFEVVTGGAALNNLIVANQQGGTNRTVNLGNVQGTATASDLTLNGDLTINTGGTLNAAVGSGSNITLKGNWTKNGTFTSGTQTTTFNGSAAQTISGTSTTFSSLTVNNSIATTPKNGVLLAVNTTVNGVLTLTASNLDTGNFTLIMPATGSSAGTTDVIGNVQRTGFVTGGAALSFGNPFNSIQVTAGAAPANIVVNYDDNPPLDFGNAIRRTYTITPSANGFTGTLRLHYNDSELNGNPEATLGLWEKSGTWAFQGGTVTDDVVLDNNYVELTGVTTFSPWTIAPNITPTAVRLTKFNAASFSDGVQLTWQSGFEVNNLGYRLYREQNGHRSRVTPSVVAGSALTVGQGNRLTAGSSYLWFDQQGTPGTSYYLEAIDLDGSRQTYGPITPYAGSRNVVSPKRQRALLLSEVGRPENNSSGTPGQPASVTNLNVSNIKLSNNSSVQQAIAGGKAVKIQVRQSGWYRVTQPELVAAGLDPTSDARLLQLYVDGEEVPVRLSAEGARLNANDTLEFYGVALDTLTTDTRTYWLINGTTDGKRISSKRNKLKPGNDNWTETVGLRNFAFTTERRDKIIYSPRLLNGDASNIFGALIFSDPTDQNLTVRNFDGTANTQPQLEIALQGLTAQSHQVHVSINGTSLGNMTFNASQHPTATFAVNPALLHAGDNTVSLSSSNGDSDVSFVDYIRLTYAHQFTADDNALRFSMPGGSVVRVDGFTTPNIRVVDVTDPSSPIEVTTSGTSSLGGYSVKVQAFGNGTRTLMAFADQLAGHPAAIFANKPSNWNASANGADLLVVTHDDFRQQVEPLAALRRGQGMSVAVVDIEDVYDEFSYGAHTPDALKAFLATASSSWSRKPGYVLLVGDSSWDPRNFMEQGENDFVPTKLIDTAFMETASDDWLVDFSGQGRAEMAVGRLPGSSAAEISLMVSKIMSYEQEREVNAPLRGAVMVADSGFESQSAQTRNLLPAGLETQSLNRSQIGNDDLMRGQLIDALNAGPMIVNFYGHGSTRVWTEAGVLDSDLADALTNSNRSSIYLMMTCLNGYASDAYIDSLSEAVLKSQNGGAVAVWASSGYTSPEPQFAMNAQFYRLLFGAQTLRLGEAAREAKLATSDLDVRRTWMLFGDPTMRVR